ncbi:MAG: hypothetical protein ABIY51_04285 [Ferruginibacter sp.]
MKSILFTILLSGCINSGFAQNIESIKVPGFSNSEVSSYFIAYQERLVNYLKAVRQNNKTAIRAAFDKDITYFDKTVKILEKARSMPADHKKALAYLSQTKPFIKEISGHPYVKELSAAYLKTQERN